MVSKIFQDSETSLLDYVMYHEMLHKKHKFYTKNGKSFHHTSDFSKDERKFENYHEMEDKIRMHIRKFKKKNGFSFLRLINGNI
jgi:hypothetical protein